jgi:replication factor C subunit 2/4
MSFCKKYEPNTFDDIIGNKKKVKQLQFISSQSNIPNLVITGINGVGKTVLSKIFIKKCNIKNIYKINLIEDFKKFTIFEKKINNFIKKIGKKIILLDECDTIDIHLQNILRGVIQKSNNTTFIFICNNSNNLIESILSHCITIRLSQIDSKSMKKRINEIIKKEKINIKVSVINQIIENSGGDFRNALNNLEILHYSNINNKKIDDKYYYSVLDIPYPKLLENVIKFCKNKNIKKSNDIIVDLYYKGYSTNDIIDKLSDVCKKTNILNDIERIKYIHIISKYYIRILDGINSIIQLISLIRELNEIDI